MISNWLLWAIPEQHAMRYLVTMLLVMFILPTYLLGLQFTKLGFVINLLWYDLIFYGWVRVKQRSAKQLLKTKGIEYEEKNIAQGYNIQDLLELVPNAKTMPQIWLDEEHIGGFSDLQKKLSD